MSTLAGYQARGPQQLQNRLEAVSFISSEGKGLSETTYRDIPPVLLENGYSILQENLVGIGVLILLLLLLRDLM
jgi:hypothetical protein